jgi:hypothetical protein
MMKTHGRNIARNVGWAARMAAVEEDSVVVLVVVVVASTPETQVDV